MYTEGNSSFSTHQGVKGLEYPRVMVIMDDTEAEGFLFSYEKLFDAKEMSDRVRIAVFQELEDYFMSLVRGQKKVWH